MKLASIRVVAALLLAVSLAGCAASKNPLGPADEAVGEPRLAGVWVTESGGADRWEYLHILPSEDGKQMQIVAVNQGDKSWAVLDSYVTVVGQRRFVNLRLATADAGLTADVAKSGRQDYPYSFAAYAFDGDDVLRIAYPLEPLYKAVKEGRLVGETSGDYDVFIGDSGANIVAVLGALDDASLFKEPKQYRRVKSPP